jgi:hypothetical protein
MLLTISSSLKLLKESKPLRLLWILVLDKVALKVTTPTSQVCKSK